MADPRAVLGLTGQDDPRAVAPADAPLTQEQRDVESFQAGASEFSKGVRSGFNSMGAGIDSLMGLGAGALGLTDYAARKFAEADATTKFADAVSPRVRSVYDIKDLSDLTDWVTGTMGQAAASSVPAVVGGVGGAAAAGLRGAMVGLGAGSFGPNAGEQAQRVRGGPGTDAQKLANSVAVGAGATALDVIPGAMVARQVMRPVAMGARQMLKKGAQVAGAESLTEGGQDVIGQVGEMALDPSKTLGTRSVVDSMAAGAVGGVGLGAAGGALSAAPGAIADAGRMGQDLLKKAREPSTSEKLDEALGTINDVRDDEDLSSIINDKTLDTPEKMVAAVEQGEADTDQDVMNIAKRGGEAFARFGNIADALADPETRADLKDTAKKWVDENKYGARAKEALDQVKQFGDKVAKAGKEGYEGTRTKKSLQRTALDARILDVVTERLPERIRSNISDDSRMAIASAVKDVVTYVRGRRPRKDEDAPASVENTMLEQIPSGMLHILGKDAHGTMEAVEMAMREDLGEGANADTAPEFKTKVREAVGRVKQRRSALEKVIHGNMKQELWANPDLRKRATEGFMGLMGADREPDYRGLTAEEGEANQRLSSSGKNLMRAAGYMFEDRRKAMRDIEALEQDEGFAAVAREMHLTEDEITEYEEHAKPDEDAPAVEEDDTTSVDGFQMRKAAEDSFENDTRLAEYDNVEDARQALRALNDPSSGYDLREVQFSHKRVMEYDEATNQMVPTGRIEVVAKSREGADALSSGEWKSITDNSPGRQAGFEHGTITVKRKDGKIIRVSMKALSKFASQTLDRTGKGRFKYDHDVVMHGLATLLGDPNVVSVAESNTRPLETDTPGVVAKGSEGYTPKKKGQKINTGLEQWAIPDDTVVAAFDKGKRQVTWGEVKDMAKLTPDELLIRQITQNPVERAEGAESLDHVEKILEKMQEKAAQLKDLMDEAPGQPNGKYEGSKPYKAAKSRYDRMLGAIERVYAEIDRREMEGDRPKMAFGESNVDQKMLDSVTPRLAEPKVNEKTGKEEWPASTSTTLRDPNGQRNVQEETGDTLHGAPRRGGPTGALDMGVHPREKATQNTEQYVEKDDGSKWEIVELDNGRFRIDSADTMAVGKATYRSRKEAIEALMGRNQELGKAEDQTKVKKSDLRIKSGEPLTDAQKKDISEYLEKVLGPKLAKSLTNKMAHAGEFFHDKDGIETIRILNDALTGFGASRHEAAHALFSRLIASDKKAAQILLAAAGSPQIISRLRTLLKDHPEALKQLSDPEERVAYMYQFWAAGELTTGPNTKKLFDKVKAFFRTIAGIWSETFNDPTNIEKAGQIFDIFDKGHLSDRNTVAEVLRDKMPKNAFDHMANLMPDAWRFFDRAFFTSDGYVRAMNIPAFNGVLDKMFTGMKSLGQSEGFNQAKNTSANRFLNRVIAAMKDTTEEDKKQAIEAMQAGTEPASAGAKRIVAGVQPLLKDVYDFMVAKKVRAVVWNDKDHKYDEHDLKFVEKYFPRYYDKSVIVEKQKEFEAMLVKNGMSRTEATALTEKITKGQPHQPNESDEEVGLTYYAPNTQSRKLDIPAAELAPFLRKDLYGTLSAYVTYAARRAEYAERFGNQGQEIVEAVDRARDTEGATKEQIEGFNKAVQAWEGSLGHGINSDMKKLFGGVMTYQNIRLLPLALFSSLVDPVGIAVRGGSTGEAFGAFARGIRGLVSEKKDEAYELALAVGSITEALDSHMMADAYGSQYLTPLQRRVNTAFFKYNGMESWNRSMRVAATAAAERVLIKHTTNPNEHSQRYLDELGITKDDVKVDAKGNLDISSLKIKGAINLFVDGAVIRPNAHLRPVWMSDPHWMLVSHLKQFTYGFQKTVIARVVHEAENGNWNPAMALLSYVPLIIAADVMRAMLTPGGGDDETLKKLDLAGVMKRGIQRAGLVGPGQYAVDAYGDLGHSKAPFVSLGGPTVQQLYDFGTAAAERGGNVGKELMKGVPGYVFVR